MMVDVYGSLASRATRVEQFTFTRRLDECEKVDHAGAENAARLTAIIETV